ncbi:Acetyltransferase (GNAT) family protein [Arthrobacter alpinus]|uniref:Acetyltransferase (GNAT) family protein n=1 Tax=Arthrobacter alpinus TaxID=656366 RepID=A0A1H5IQP6_9MICC|nr:GNAT family N-acetyltransferase [Arthrobacter alpinus]SEE42583.1 Acetyltransferase (GNAT) family protein [Arthrobacter alpinus]
MTIIVRPATPERWDDVATVFGTRGNPSWCACQYFIDPEWNRGGEANMQSLREQVDSARPAPGLIAYQDGDPVGWIQVSPSSRFPRFKPRGHEPDDGVWAVTCFVVRVGHRGTGVATALLHGALDHARGHGASMIRARPSDTTVADKSNADLFTGILSTFAAAGFTELNRNRSRVLVELKLP